MKSGSELNKKRGFSLVELLVVVAVIALLTSAITASLSTARQKSRDARRLSDIKQRMSALELYHSGKGRYPDSYSCRSSIPGGNWCNSYHSLYDNGNRWISDSGVLYPLRDFIDSEPKDPTPRIPTAGDWNVVPGVYYYYSRPAVESWRDAYMIILTLEQKGHPLEKLDGIMICDASSTKYDYGGVAANSGILTLGSTCGSK